MSAGLVVAIVGATGAVGQEMLRVLEQRRFPVAELRLLASPRSAARRLAFAGREHVVRALDDETFADVDVALFSAGASVARAHAPRARDAGALVVDNSSAFRMSPEVPLVVPEVNGTTAADHAGILANPNCSTILLVLALAPIHRAAGLKRVVVSTYQAASGAGQRAVDELRDGTRAALEGRAFAPQALPHDLAFNLFPQVDVFEPSGYTREEDKLLHETRRILDLADLAVDATCVRVPVERCHSEAVTVETDRRLGPEDARALLANAAGIEVIDDPASRSYPQPIRMSGRDAVAVGRIRASRVFPGGLSFWLAGDQLRKGAALNAVQIAEVLR